MATYSSILACEIPWTEEPGGLLSTSSQELDTTEQLYHYHRMYKNKLKWVKDPYVRLNTIKLLEENICRTLFDINHSSFLDLPPRVMEMNTKINRTLLNLKALHSKGNHKQD